LAKKGCHQIKLQFGSTIFPQLTNAAQKWRSEWIGCFLPKQNLYLKNVNKNPFMKSIA